MKRIVEITKTEEAAIEKTVAGDIEKVKKLEIEKAGTGRRLLGVAVEKMGVMRKRKGHPAAKPKK